MLKLWSSWAPWEESASHPLSLCTETEGMQQVEAEAEAETEAEAEASAEAEAGVEAEIEVTSGT